ncbi:cysteine--tRNA ligase [Candidatus Acidulodesulfobacterium sp. H_13]|uniref:cysteine--tRNA ligase n=1 Tax=Candidatus Acidulodesulfobacterium sp. H_13 TaxID=3395470 RepID=UPI003AF9F36D
MNLYIYNTLSLSKELFKPLNKNSVLMYVCGITAYDFSHIGHARAYITFDIIYRYLMHLGYKVVYVRNFTDIDDKIIKRANSDNSSVEEVSSKYIEKFREDMKRLSVLNPSYEPRAMETIGEMINLIKDLIKGKHAYEINGDVFFRVGSFKNYGKLSHKNIDELIAGARIPLNEEKENLLDFALWKRSKEGEPSWDSPWGKGRPGWHIECSAMSMKFLGESIDIHGGGSDLVFPHHENEIAQSESFTGKKFVNYWIHNGFVNVNNEKMSKSLKNFVTVRDVLDKHNPEAMRLFFMFTHYRSYIDFSLDGIESANRSLMRLYQSINLYDDFKSRQNGGFNLVLSASDKSGENIEHYKNEFYEAMNDDFNTAQAISVIFNLVRKTNKIINDSLSQKVIMRGDSNFLDEAMLFIKKTLSEIFGILNENVKRLIESNVKDIPKVSLSEEEIKRLIKKRNTLRENKEYKFADEIRNKLLEKGVVLEDTGLGTTYKTGGK